MKTISKVLVAGLIGLAAFSSSASACGNRVPTVPRPVMVVPQPNGVPQLNTVPQPIPNPPIPGNGIGLNDAVVNDLPADAKRAIKAAAAKARSTVQVRNASNSRTYGSVR